jgi:hypothetical protein
MEGFMKCTDLVIQDHIALRRALDILDGMINKLERGDRIEIADAAEILKFLRTFGIEYHQTIAAVEHAIAVRKGIDFVLNSRGLIVLLRNHYDREDAVLRSPTISKEAQVNLASLESKYTAKPNESLAADRTDYAKWKSAKSV